MKKKDTFTFGKHKGATLKEVMERNPGYVVWCVENIEWFKISKNKLTKCEMWAGQESSYSGFDGSQHDYDDDYDDPMQWDIGLTKVDLSYEYS